MTHLTPELERYIRDACVLGIDGGWEKNVIRFFKELLSEIDALRYDLRKTNGQALAIADQRDKLDDDLASAHPIGMGLDNEKQFWNIAEEAIDQDDEMEKKG